MCMLMNDIFIIYFSPTVKVNWIGISFKKTKKKPFNMYLKNVHVN